MLYAGLRVGRLTLSHVVLGTRGASTRWVCRCDCGNVTTVAYPNLHTGHTRSCGCLKRELASQLQRSHGHASAGKPTTTYLRWAAMLQRCTNPKNVRYADYGGRGIRVCDRWRSFENFLADMGEAPKGLTLDRLDNNRGYEPGNCAWRTYTQQNNNRRRAS